MNISFVEIYTLTTEDTDEGVEKFYKQIRTALETSHSPDIVFMADDFVVKVSANCFDRDTYGRHELGTLNERGETLLNFCRNHDLFITYAAFKHHDRC